MSKYVISLQLAIIPLFFYPLYSYEFQGKHFFASYRKCDEYSLRNITQLLTIFEKAVESTGATILTCDYKNFSNDGITIFIVLSESHASIHTYPEHCACFVDLFTCGDHCLHEPFDQILTQYLQPKEISHELHVRK